jgi:hypothetical protein
VLAELEVAQLAGELAEEIRSKDSPTTPADAQLLAEADALSGRQVTERSVPVATVADETVAPDAVIEQKSSSDVAAVTDGVPTPSLEAVHFTQPPTVGSTQGPHAGHPSHSPKVEALLRGLDWLCRDLAVVLPLLFAHCGLLFAFAQIPAHFFAHLSTASPRRMSGYKFVAGAASAVLVALYYDQLWFWAYFGTFYGFVFLLFWL